MKKKQNTSTLLATSLWVCAAESLLEPSNGRVPAAQQHHPSPVPRHSPLLTSSLACRTPPMEKPRLQGHQEHPHTAASCLHPPSCSHGTSRPPVNISCWDLYSFQPHRKELCSLSGEAPELHNLPRSSALLLQGHQRAEALALQTWEVRAGLSNITAMHRYQHFTFL